ncbi:MAG: type II secretion system F family protein [Saprospiraceae bacterium]|nr:type II secretion system F family protein [Saprospiraceae bacterium]
MPIKLENYKAPSAIIAKRPNAPSAGSGESWWQKDIQLFGKGLDAKQKKSLYTELSVLLSAGLDIQKALTLIEESRTKKSVQGIIARIREQVIAGSALSEALHASGDFTAYETVSIRIGEESGKLTTVLNELSDFFTKTVKFRQQLLGALSYPIFVTGFAFTVVFFLLKYLVPMFSDVYKRFDSELPAITQRIIWLSDWVGRYGSLLLLAFVGIGALLYFWRKQTWLRKASATLLLRLPLFGDIVKQIYLARFCQSMCLLLGAKVSLLRAVELVKEMCAFYPLEVSLEAVGKDIMDGKSLHEALAAYPFYPPQLTALLRVGEETGKLDQMFGKLADQYNDGVDARTAVIGSLLEPVLIIGLGILVGVILVAMYLPLFQMSTSVGR